MHQKIGLQRRCEQKCTLNPPRGISDLEALLSKVKAISIKGEASPQEIRKHTDLSLT